MSIKKQIFLLILIILSATACKTNRAVVQTIPNVQKIDLPKINDKIQEFNFVYLSAKAKISYKDFEQSFKSAVDIRIKKDSAIWLSFRPAMGIEAMRVLITQDSIKILDRLKGENYLYSIRELSKTIKFNLKFELLQAAITGNFMSKVKPDSISQIADFQIVRQKEKAIRIENYVGNNNGKIHKVMLEDLVTSNAGQINYSEFGEASNQIFAFWGKVVLNYYTQTNEVATAEIELKYSKVETKQKYLRFPF